jgi:hypothetical protein
MAYKWGGRHISSCICPECGMHSGQHASDCGALNAIDSVGLTRAIANAKDADVTVALMRQTANAMSVANSVDWICWMVALGLKATR